jgi:hypothetical protein
MAYNSYYASEFNVQYRYGKRNSSFFFELKFVRRLFVICSERSRLEYRRCVVKKYKKMVVYITDIIALLTPSTAGLSTQNTVIYFSSIKPSQARIPAYIYVCM